MSSALIVSRSEKAVAFFTNMLKKDGYHDVIVLQSAAETRRAVTRRDINLCIIDMPVKDDPRGNLALDVSDNAMCQVMVAVKSEDFEEMTLRMEQYGVVVVAKPINVPLFWNTLHLAKAMTYRMLKVQKEKEKLMQKMTDLRYVSRAKIVLVSVLSMSETEAHRFIEKQAMDLRVSKREVAESILKTYGD